MSANNINFESTPTPSQDGKFSIYQANNITSGVPYENIGGLVQSGASAINVQITEPELSLNAKLKNLWLVIKNGGDDPSSTYAIVIDLDEEITIINPAAADADLLQKLIDTKISLKINRIIYSKSLGADSGNDIFGTNVPPQVDWPDAFDSGLVGEFSFVLADHETAFSLVYRAASGDSSLAESDGGGEEGAGQNDVKQLPVNEKTPVFALDSVLATYTGLGLNLSMDASVTIGPLTGKLIHFEVDIDLGAMSITVDLNGVGIGYNSPPISIAGALIKEGDDLNGGLAIGLTEWSMVALGSVGTVMIDSKKIPSVFIYGYLGGELVNIEGIVSLNGIAATLGFNRDLVTPTDLSALPDHPLIAAAASAPDSPVTLDDLTKILENLGDIVPPSAGSFFFGLGLKGELVELVSLYVLPVIELEVDFSESPPAVEDVKIQIYGLGELGLPADDPILALEIAMVGAFSVRQEEVLVGGELTDNSGITLLPELELGLSGGAAFYFGPSGNANGGRAFVLTAGGYGSLITPNPNWPTVDPISLSWNPTKDISISSTFYFALLPKCFALGFGINGTAKYGGDVFSAGASFNFGIDFLLQWKPFLFTAEAHAAFHAYVKVSLGISVEATFDIQAQAKLWGGTGKKLSGKAELHVHLLISINLSVSWGDKESDSPPPISWEEFRDSFVPKNKDKTQLALTSIKLSKGLTGMVENSSTSKTYAAIQPAGLEMKVEGFFPPSQGIQYNNNPVANSTASNVGIQMMGYTPSQYQSAINANLNVSVVNQKDSSLVTVLDVTVIYEDVPAAFWMPASEPGQLPAIDPNGDDLVYHVPKGLLIKATTPTEGAHFKIAKSNLEFDITEGNDIAHQAAENIAIGNKQTETAVIDAMIDHRPETNILAAFGITEAPEFSKLKATDLDGVPYLVG